MSTERSSEDGLNEGFTYEGTSVLQIYQTQEGEWRVTQEGLTIFGTGDSVPRATEDFARQLAEAKECGEL